MPTIPDGLKYLFLVEFLHGEPYEQSADDKPKTAESGSAFSDIVPRLKDVKAFYLTQEGGIVAGVNLETGHFLIRGQQFEVTEQNFIKVNPLELIYFRETRKEQDIKATVEADMSISEEVVRQAHYVNRYFIGWKTADRFGKVVQHTIALD